MRGRKLAVWLLALLLCAGLAGPSAAAASPDLTIWGYSEGLALAEQDGKWGYVNAARQIVIPIQFNSAVSFSMGIAAVNLNGRLGVIRPDGSYLIKPEYDTLMPINCGLYLAQKGVQWGVVSILPFPDGKNGQTNVVYDFIYENAQVLERAGVQVLSLTREGAHTMVPLFDLPDLLVDMRVPSAQFPLNRGRLPQFSDVSPRDWYAVWVDIAYNVGLTSGVGENRFGPQQTLTVAEALKLAATMDSRYKADNFHLQSTPSGSAWYRPAVDYCLASGIIRAGEFGLDDYTRPVTRAEMAHILDATSLGKDMPAINDLNWVKAQVPDVDADTPYANAIYRLYAKGILNGVDGSLAFHPDDTLSRAEMAAIVSRMARAEQRLTLY